MMNLNDDEIKSQNEEVETCTVGKLNDYSLLQIFNRLNISDLCNAVDVNHHFKRVAKMSFAGRYATFHYPQNLNLPFPPSSESYKVQMRRVLCKFGDSIKSMKLKDFDPAGVFIGIRVYPIESDAISKFCAGTLNDLNLDLFLTLKCDGWSRPLFSSLTTLTIQCGAFNGDVGGLFSECQKLRTLRLTSVPYNDSVSEVAQEYRKLEELYIEHTVTMNAETTFALLQMNRQIKKLDMPDDHANETIYAIASKMDGLEELVLRTISERNHYYENVTELASLKSLKVLELHDVAPDSVATIEAMESIPLDSFKWFNCPTDLQFTNRITKLKTLKTLALTGISLPFDDCLAKFGEQLPLLHDLELGFKHQEKPVISIDCLIRFVARSTELDVLVIHTIHFEVFNQQFYDALLDVIVRRSKPINVKIYCRGSTALQMHSNLLQVKFVECEYFPCSHCDPTDSVASYENYDFDDDDDEYDYGVFNEYTFEDDD